MSMDKICEFCTYKCDNPQCDLIPRAMIMKLYKINLEKLSEVIKESDENRAKINSVIVSILQSIHIKEDTNIDPLLLRILDEVDANVPSDTDHKSDESILE